MKLTENYQNRIKKLAGINENLGNSVNSFLPDDVTQENKQLDSEPEGAHYKSALNKISTNAQEIDSILIDNDELDPWVQDKITIAKHNMEAILDFLSEKKQSVEKSN